MPRLMEAMKDVLSCDKPRGAAKKLWSEDFRMGQPNMVWIILLYLYRANAGKWNISVPAGKEINRDSHSSGERNGNSPKLLITIAEYPGMDSHRRWKPGKRNQYRYYSSRSGHEKPWLNMGGPPSKAKYYHQTDSEPVPWGKGEKNAGEASEIEPETVCLQSFRALWFIRVMDCLLHNEPASCGIWQG